MIILHFLLTLLVILIVHEAGHLIAARSLGILVKTFSIGLGPALFNYKYWGIHWRLGCVPLGGYVQFFEPDQLETLDIKNAYVNQTVWKKAIVILAGPLANFLLAYVIFVGIFMQGVMGVVPMVASVHPTDHIMLENIVPKDQLMAVNEQVVETVQAANQQLLSAMLSQREAVLTLKRGGQLVEGRLWHDFEFVSKASVAQWVGLLRWQAPDFLPIVGQINPESPAQLSSFHQGDRIISADGKVIESWHKWRDYVQARPNVAINVSIIRRGGDHQLKLIPQRKIINGQAVGFAGMGVDQSQANALNVAWQSYGFFESFQYGFDRFIQVFWLSIRSIGGLFSGFFGLDNLSGPISIAYYADQSAEVGILEFLSFIALLSIGIGLMNLLPVPILDGGQFVWLFLEKLRFFRQPSVQRWLYFLSVLAILALFVVAIYNDLKSF